MPANSRYNNSDVNRLIKKISEAQTILLTTHKQCDGDGLGAQLGLYHALKKMGKTVRVFCVDEIPKKYSYLNPNKFIEIYENPHSPIEKTDLALIFDTNDRRLVEPLYGELENHCKEILFVDHHPVLNQGPEPTAGSFIDTRAASTGEIAYFLIKGLGVRLDKLIARALYTSIAFDTQIFRYIRNSPTSHVICADLLEYERNPEEIHRNLFATHTQDKITFLAKVLADIDFTGNGRIAILRISLKDLDAHNMDADDARDIIDMIMNIGAVQAAALFREEEPGGYKLSLRSKGKMEILGIAENFQGGGHMYAAGAFMTGDYDELKSQVAKQLSQRLETFEALELESNEKESQ